MKRPAIVSIILLILFANISCKKDKVFKREDVRLTSTEWARDGITHRTLITYNTDGKISKVSEQTNEDAPTTYFDVQYLSDAIQLIQPANNSINTADTIRLYLGSNGQLVRRIRFSFFEVKPPVGFSQRTYTYDTTSYEYDASGFVTRETQHIQDSTWSNNGSVQTTVNYNDGVTNYTISNANLVTAENTMNTSYVGRTSTTVYSGTLGSSTSAVNYEYAAAAPNNTDYSNAAVLNELNLFPIEPMNKNFAQLPTKKTATTIQKDRNGVVTSSDSYTSNYSFTYTLLGLVASQFDPAHPETKLVYTYSY